MVFDEEFENMTCLKFEQFLKMKRYENYSNDDYILCKSFGNYYYSYCADNGYIAEDLSSRGCPMPYYWRCVSGIR